MYSTESTSDTFEKASVEEIKIDPKRAQLAQLRIRNEFKDLENAFEIGTLSRDRIQVKKLSDTIWRLAIRGKINTIWEEGIYCATIRFTALYPSEAPHITFDADFEHVHIYEGGDVCLDLLHRDLTYKATTKMQVLISQLDNLIHADPNPKSPANSSMSRLYQENLELYKETVKKTATLLSTKKFV